MAGISEDEFPKCNGSSGFISSSVIDYHKLDDIVSGNFVPQRGDVILYTKEEGAAPSHTGLVNSWTKSDDGTTEIKTVEGNVSNKVVERTYIANAAGELNRKNWYVCGVGRPNYKDKSDNSVSVDNQSAATINVYVFNRTIVVENATDEIRVYDVMGRLVCRDATPCIRAELRMDGAGVYIVKIGNLAKRVIVE